MSIRQGCLPAKHGGGLPPIPLAIETEQPFILGTSPLLSIDTWLEQRPGYEQVKINKTHIGRTDLLMNPLAFSPSDINQRLS